MKYGMNYHRQITKEEIDMNDLKAIKKKLDSFRIRIQAGDYRNVMEEAIMKAKAEELYERCKEIAPEEVAEYEAFVKEAIRRKVRKDTKKAVRVWLPRNNRGKDFARGFAKKND